jgi:hypothetical protein
VRNSSLNFRFPADTRVDVYSYNFLDDRRLLKILGTVRDSFAVSSNSWIRSNTVYFVFLLETVQTALTGADVYYWFAVGFGDLEGLR